MLRARSTLIIACAALLAACHGKQVKIGENGEMFYKSPVTKAQAKAIGVYFKSSGLFDDGKRKSIKVTKSGDVFQLRFVVPRAKGSAASAIKSLKLMSGLISHQVLGGNKIELHFADKYFKTWKTIPVPAALGDMGRRFRFDMGELFVEPPLGEKLAAQVGTGLRKRKIFNTKTRATIALAKKDGTYHLRLIAKKDDAKMKVFFRQLGIWLSVNSLAGAPIQVHMCDELFTPVHDLPVDHPGQRAVFDKGSVFYVASASKAEARQLGKELQAAKFFTVKRSVQVGKKDERFQLKFVVNQASLNEQQKAALGGLVSGLTWVKAGKADIFLTDSYFGSPRPFSAPGSE